MYDAWKTHGVLVRDRATLWVLGHLPGARPGSC